MNGIEKFNYYAKEYLDDVKHSHKSEQTVTNYANAFKQFTEYWLAYGDIEDDPRTPLFRSWKNFMDEKGLKSSTIKQYLMALHIFFSYYEDEDDGEGLVYGGRNPVSKKLYPKQEKRPYDMILSDEDVAKLWVNECPTCKQKHAWPRNYAIVTLLLDSKIRNAELLELKLSDIDFEEHTLWVDHGKGNKARLVDINPISETAVKLYLASGLRPSSLSDDDYLFGTTADESGLSKKEEWHKGTSQWLSSLIERHVYAVTGVHDVRSHDLRHIGARLDLNTGATMEQVSSELGHANFSTTQIYAGKLQARKGRQSAKQTIEVRDEWAERNREMLYDIS